MDFHQRYFKNSEVKEKIYSIRISENLLKKITEKAREQHMSTNLYLNVLIAKDLEEK